MSENRFMWNSVDGGDNLFIKDRKAESDKLIHIRLIDGKYEFAELMKTINELNDENEQLRSELKKLKKKEKSWKKIHCCNKESNNCGIVIEQQAEIERLQKIIDLTQYQLKVQDRILKEVGE